jgi:hypothetical protein
MHRTPADGWISTLDHSDYCWRGWVRSPEGLAGWVADLGHPDDLVRAHAARALGQAGGVAECAVPRLRQLLADPKTAVRFAAARALQQIGVARARGEGAGAGPARPGRLTRGLTRLLHALWPWLTRP